MAEVEIDSRYVSRHGSLCHYHQLHIPLQDMLHFPKHQLSCISESDAENLILPNAVSDSEDDGWQGFFQVAPTPIKR